MHLALTWTCQPVHALASASVSILVGPLRGKPPAETVQCSCCEPSACAEGPDRYCCRGGLEKEGNTCFGRQTRFQVSAEALQEGPPSDLPHVQLRYLWGNGRCWHSIALYRASCCESLPGVAEARGAGERELPEERWAARLIRAQDPVRTLQLR